ncbi:MAG: hypothetical protein KDC95_09330 [Planctomycetes bacterium]|nr:hypothetical protein [Planctomycetota bacterium]
MDLERLRHAAEHGELIKDSALRRVVRGTLDGRSVILKEYRVRGAIERTRALWLRSRAVVEARNLRQARSRGIRSPEPLFTWVERALSPSVAWLVLEDLGSGQSADERLRGTTCEHERVRFAERCGSFLAECAARGLRHRDLHLGNVFVKGDTGASGELFVLDLHAAAVRPHPVQLRPRDFERLWLSLPWPEHAPEREALSRALGITVESALAHRWLRRHLRKRIDRALRPSGAFRRVGGVEFTMLRRSLARRLEEPTAESLRADIRDGRMLKQGRRGVVVQVTLTTRGGTTEAIAKSRKEARSIESWIHAEELALRDLPHARSLATLRASGCSVLGACASDRFILSERVDPALAITEWQDDACFVDRLARQFGRIVGRLHATGLRCRDPRFDNFVVRETNAGAELTLVDLDGITRLPRIAAWRAMAADLGRALAWLECESPEPIRRRSRSIAARAFEAWQRELVALGGRHHTSKRERTRIVRAARYRQQRWRTKHATTASTTSAPEVAGSASVDASSPSR